MKKVYKTFYYSLISEASKYLLGYPVKSNKGYHWFKDNYIKDIKMIFFKSKDKYAFFIDLYYKNVYIFSIKAYIGCNLMVPYKANFRLIQQYELFEDYDAKEVLEEGDESYPFI